MWELALSLLGNLADLGLGDIFQIVSLSRRSGTLQLTTPAESGEIVFDAGRVVAVYCTGSSRAVGEGLMGKGLLNATTYQEILALQSSGVAGAALFENVGLSLAAVEDAMEGLLKETIYDMFTWEEGTFSFVLEAKPDPWRGFGLNATRVVVQRGVNPQYLAIEGARLRDERAKDDVLGTFLGRDKPRPEVVRPPRTVEAETFAARLVAASEPEAAAPITAAALPDTLRAPLPAREPVPERRESDDADKVIPFPAARARREAPAVTTAAPVPAAPTPLAAAERSVTLAPARKSAWKLLVVDDDPQITTCVADEYLGRFAAVSVANTVKDALQQIDAAGSGLVVACDLTVARSDGAGILGGLEVAEYLRQRTHDVPLLLFSDYENNEAEVRAQHLGVTAFLMKPRKAQIQGGKDKGPYSAPLQAFLHKLNAALEEFSRRDPPGHPGREAPTTLPAPAPLSVPPRPETILTEVPEPTPDREAGSEAAPVPTVAERQTPLAEPAAEPTPEVVAEPMPEPIPEAEAEATPEALAEPIPEAEAEAEPIPEMDAEAQATPEALAEPMPEPVPEPVPEPIPEAEAEAEATPEAIPEPAPEPIPESVAEPTPDSVPEATAAPTPQLVSQSLESSPAAPPDVGAAPASAPEPVAGAGVEGAASPPSHAAPQDYDLRREVAGMLDEVDVPGSDELPQVGRLEGPVGFLRSMLGELVDPASRDTVTLLVLRFASHMFERAAIWLVTRRAYVGLGGFSVNEDSDSFVGKVRRIHIGLDNDSLFDKVVRFRAAMRTRLEHTPGNERLIKGMGGAWPVTDVVALPLISSDRVAAILYGDNPSGVELPPIETLEIFLQQAGVAMDRALLERKLEESRRSKKSEPEPG
ncbi:MAG: DUF4388 domain-containing protein [Deltaproteobacteria bacterium]|nr:DUF4388 domain-containing protein [Deltaproteobacteria bacterium]